MVMHVFLLHCMYLADTQKYKSVDLSVISISIISISIINSLLQIFWSLNFILDILNLSINPVIALNYYFYRSSCCDFLLSFIPIR